MRRIGLVIAFVVLSTLSAYSQELMFIVHQNNQAGLIEIARTAADPWPPASVRRSLTI
jgi:hypothetical protein